MVKRGEIWLVKLDPTVGSEIRKTRPAVIIQNNVGNRLGRTIIVAPITSRIKRVHQHEAYLGRVRGLPLESKALCHQIRTLDKSRLDKRLGMLADAKMQALDTALGIALDLY